MSIRKQTKKWSMKNGTKIRICDMDDSHLYNTISMIEHMAKVKTLTTINRMLSFSLPVGDMAQLAFDNEFDYITSEGYQPEEISPLYENLLLERERRKEMGKDSWEFYVAGVQHHNLRLVIDEVMEGDRIQMVPEPQNKYDPNAIKLHYESAVWFEGSDKEVMIGYVPGRISAEIAAFLQYGNEPICVVTEIEPTAKPWNQLKVGICELEDY